jgi:hypothetical protein
VVRPSLLVFGIEERPLLRFLVPDLCTLLIVQDLREDIAIECLKLKVPESRIAAHNHDTMETRRQGDRGTGSMSLKHFETLWTAQTSSYRSL